MWRIDTNWEVGINSCMMSNDEEDNEGTALR